jgi:probable phosphoglycerate mutase
MNSLFRRLYVLRHGEVAYFDEERRPLGGRTAPLTERGRKQIGDLAERLAGCGVDLLVTSTLPRALESAGILANRLALTQSRTKLGTSCNPAISR